MLIASQKLVSAPYIIGSQTLNTSGLFYHPYTVSCAIATIYRGMFTILSVTLTGPHCFFISIINSLRPLSTWSSHLHVWFLLFNSSSNVHVGNGTQKQLCCTCSFLGHRLVIFFDDATIRESKEKDCLYWVPKNCERWPEGGLKAAEANLRWILEYEAAPTSDWSDFHDITFTVDEKL